MKRACLIILVAALIPAIPAPAQPGSSDPPLSIEQYAVSLNSLLEQTRKLPEDPQRVGFLRDSLPPAWHVQLDDKQLNVSADPLRRDMAAWQAKQDDATLERMIRQLETLRSDAETARLTKTDAQPQRIHLESILARREFNAVHGPTWWDRLKQRITAWLFRIIGRAITSSSIPAISDIVVYSLIGLALLALGWWMYRSVRESGRLETIMPEAVPVSAKEWPVWLSEARAAAANGQWRDAIHLSYWAGISFLEAQGSWRPDAARTPREYLRLLSSTSVHQPTLRSLTRQLEDVWYGMHPADAESFKQTLADLERLGCPCN